MKVLLLLFALYQAGSAAVPEVQNIANPCSGSGYAKALCMSYVFYEAQRSGPLPGDQRVTWRGDSALGDGNDVGHDLTGGYYDAGDHVKFGFPMAFTATMLGWGLIDFESGHSNAGQLGYGRAALRWATDYFIKCHTAERELWGQVGDGNADHSFWGRPEDMTMSRPSYKIDSGAPALSRTWLAETAAALAAASIVFKNSDSGYSNTLLTHAKQLFDFADQNRGIYSDSIWAAADFYRSWSGYGDELCWAAAWLYRATNDNTYLDKAKNFWNEFGVGNTPSEFSWDNKNAGSQALLSLLDGGSTYKNAFSSTMNSFRSKPTTPGGMVFISEWGSSRHAANAAFLGLFANKIGVDASTNYNFGKGQIDYLLGTNTGRSFVVGYGSGPERPHHRSSSCPDMPEYCDGNWALSQSGPNPQTLYGALVGGPGQDGSYNDDRNDYVKNEVACDYNAAFTGALAALVYVGSADISFSRVFREGFGRLDLARVKAVTSYGREGGGRGPLGTYKGAVESLEVSSPSTAKMKVLLLLFALYQSGFAAAPEAQNIANPCSGSGYAQALCMSYVFYEAQRSGVLPSDQRVTWRQDSALNDGSDVGHDLTGGYYDAGDHVKFGFPMAFTATLLSWGLIDFESGHSSAGQLDYGRAAVRWATDYFIKCHTAEREFWGQVGYGESDHAFWGRPEDMTMSRPSYKIDTGAPGSDLAGETAAALAAASIVFKSSDSGYSNTLLTHAKQLFDFADQNRGLYSNSIPDAANYYNSWSGYNDELVWAATWLYRATNDNSYLDKAKNYWDEFGIQYSSEFSWDNKAVGVQALLSLVDGGSTYTSALSSSLAYVRTSYPYTPGGMIFMTEWGSARAAANFAFLALVVSMRRRGGVEGKGGREGRQGKRREEGGKGRRGGKEEKVGGKEEEEEQEGKRGRGNRRKGGKEEGRGVG
ncbi:uncharacterized protein LOC126992936 [Eriocheir sinensis]|uniref:uncharacterized protein LOC126992936 n=1 Tax=Eriocheir sinensis TaxID=95602 RepID=UPI0021C5B9B6|nr:uncharacterized protein LOC126992936 [Eriocheir sinensis]